RLNEMAIIMAGRKWTAQYEFHAHRRLALEAGLSPAIADAIATNQRPASVAKDEEAVYEFGCATLVQGRLSDPALPAVHRTVWGQHLDTAWAQCPELARSRHRRRDGGGDGQGRRRRRDLHLRLFHVPLRRELCGGSATGSSRPVRSRQAGRPG